MKIRPVIAEVSNTVNPQVRAPLNMGIAITKALYQASETMESASRDWQRVGQIQQRVEAEKKKWDDHDAILSNKTDAELGIDDILNQAERSDPAEHSSLYNTGTKSLETLKKSILDKAYQINPEVSQGTSRIFQPIFANASIKLKDIQNKKFLQNREGEILKQKQRLEDTAPMMPEKVTMPDGSVAYPRQNQIDFFNSYIDQSTREVGVPTPANGQKIKESFRENVAINAVKLSAKADPLGTIEKLARGETGKDIPLDKIQMINSFIETQLRAKDAEKRRGEADAKKAIEDNQRQIKNVLQGLIDSGRGPEALANASYLRDQGYLDFNDVTWVRNEIESQNRAAVRVQKEENPLVKARLTEGVYGMPITITQEDLKKALDNGDIDLEKTYKPYLNELTSRMEADRKEKKTEKQRMLDKSYENGKESMRLFFTLEGPGATVIDQEAKVLHSDAISEYFGLVYREGMDPHEALDLVLPRYGRALDTRKSAATTKLRQALIVDNKDAPAEQMAQRLDAMRMQIPKVTYEQNQRMILQIADLEKFQFEEKARRAAQKEKKANAK